MTTTTPITAGHTEGDPPRPRARLPGIPRLLRRRPGVSAFVALVLLAVVVRVIWGWHLSRLVAKRVAEIRAAVHPTTLAEVVIEQVPDGENAWPAFVRAIPLNRSECCSGMPGGGTGTATVSAPG